MSAGTVERPKNDVAKPSQNLPALAGSRIPYHPVFQDRYGIDAITWRALVESIFPNAQSMEAMALVLSYCKARNLDVFKRPCHIVPIWSKELGRLVDTVWPGIGELRTTATRTGAYAGTEPAVLGPIIEKKVGTVSMIYPEWVQVTVYRMVQGARCAFPGPQVRYLETYATASRNSDDPNDMWRNRPFGQLEKCAEAAALRKAFPEECGADFIPEEMERQNGRAHTIVSTATVVPEGKSKTQAIREQMKQRIENKEAEHLPTETTQHREPETVLRETEQNAEHAGTSQESPPEPTLDQQVANRIANAIAGNCDDAKFDEIRQEIDNLPAELRPDLLAKLDERQQQLAAVAKRSGKKSDGKLAGTT